MTTSNSTDFSINCVQCIEMALSEIGVYTEGDYISSYDYGLAKKYLNMLLKSWQGHDPHLWLRQQATIFLQYGQNYYRLSSISSDHITTDEIKKTTIKVGAIAGDTVITVMDSTTFVDNDYIGIKMDNNYLFWSTIVSKPTPTTIQITDPLSFAVSIGNYVYGYTNKTSTPFQIYSAVRRYSPSDIDVPMTLMSYNEYQQLPNKNVIGVPTMWAYDRPTDYMGMWIWLSPGDVNYYVIATIGRKIQDVDVNADNFDLPQEWLMALVKNLAVALAPSYGRAQGDNFAELKLQAALYFQDALRVDSENTAVYFTPSPDGSRNPGW